MTTRANSESRLSANAGGPEKFCPTFYLDLTFGFTTYKSEMVANNDYSTQSSFTIGGNAGSMREFGFYIKQETNTTAFELNTSSIASSWLDMGLRYRFWGYFYLGIIFSQLEMVSSNQGTDELNAQGKGMGGNTGFIIPFGKDGIFFFDATSASFTSGINSLDQTVTFGTRTDIDLGAAIDITKKAFDFLIGYKQRTFSITTNAAYVETIYQTYIGARWASFF